MKPTKEQELLLELKREFDSLTRSASYAIPLEVAEKLRQQAKEQGITASKIVRDALYLWFFRQITNQNYNGQE